MFMFSFTFTISEGPVVKTFAKVFIPMLPQSGFMQAYFMHAANSLGDIVSGLCLS